MKARKIISLILVLLGLIIFLFAMYAKHRVMEVKSSIHSGSSLLPNNPVDREIGKALDKKVGSYDAPILWATIGGVVLVVIGVGMFTCCRRK